MGMEQTNSLDIPSDGRWVNWDGRKANGGDGCMQLFLLKVACGRNLSTTKKGR